MTAYEALSPRRFYRNSDRAMVAGVCAGIADYFGFNLRATRVLAFICLLMAMPITLLVYFGTVFLVPSAPDMRRQEDRRSTSGETLHAASTRTMSDVRQRYQSMDSRLARLERYVTSSRFDLDQEIRNL